MLPSAVLARTGLPHAATSRKLTCAQAACMQRMWLTPEQAGCSKLHTMSYETFTQTFVSRSAVGTDWLFVPPWRISVCPPTTAARGSAANTFLQTLKTSCSQTQAWDIFHGDARSSPVLRVFTAASHGQAGSHGKLVTMTQLIQQQADIVCTPTSLP